MNESPPSAPAGSDGLQSNVPEHDTPSWSGPEARSHALAQLAQQLTAAPERILAEIAAATRALCGAGGVAFSSVDAHASEVLRWQLGAPAQHAAGELLTLTGGSGVPVWTGGAVALIHPVRDCAELAAADPAAVEALVVPIHLGGERVGALWALGHAPDRRFGADDAQLVAQLAAFAAVAYQADERERTQAALERERDELHDLVDNAAIPVRSIDANGIIRWANRAELELLGYERDEYVGRPIGDFHADPDALRVILAQLQHGERVENAPCRLIRKDGAVLDMLASSNVLWRDGAFVHTRCFSRDVTEQKADEHARSWLAAVVESSQDAIVSKDLDGWITSWNAGATELFGYTAEEAVGAPITILIPPDRLDEEPEILARIRSGGRVAHFETVRRRKDGALVEISLTVSPVFDAQGTIIGASKIARDITERKRAERDLTRARAESDRQRRLYETVMDATPDLAYVVDREFRFTFANQALLEMWGQGLEAARGRRLLELGYQPWHAQMHEDEFRHILATGESVRGEVPFEHATRGRRIYDYIFVPVIDEDGRVESIVGTTRDVTDFKQNEEDLAEANRQLEQRVRERTEQLERQAGRLRELATELTTAEQRERKRLAAMLHDELQQLLVAAQIQLGRTRGRIEDDDTAGAISAAERLLDEGMSASRNLTRQLRPPVLYEDGLVSALKGLGADVGERQMLTVGLDADDGVPLLRGDLGALLFESVRELLLNAAKYAGVERVEIEVRQHGDLLRLIVSDHGRGFAGGLDTMSGQGYDGFGLFSIRERLGALGGALTIDSAPGEGTRVEMEVPVAGADRAPALDAPQPGAGQGEAGGESSGRRIRVLIADDHVLVRQGIAQVLGKHERVTSVLEAGDGVEALELIEREEPDVVLMDVNMPHMNGLEATREASRRWPALKTVGLSVQDDDATAGPMRDAGAVDFLPKSGDAGQMIAKLLALVDAPGR